MAVCTFFGHRDCPETVRQRLKSVLVELITNNNVTTFYVGNQGQFDAYVRNELQKIQQEYPQINYAVVLAYMPCKEIDYADRSNTLLPEGIEDAPPRYAISWRNNWMLKQADYVVAYVTHSWGGAAQYTKKAEKQGKTVINLG